jgi:large subunit ribosomal protein L6
MSLAVTESYVGIPDGVELVMEGKRVTIKGKKGAITKDFWHIPLNMELQDRRFRLWTESSRKKERALVNTIAAHIRNMIKGVEDGFTSRLKLVYVHFPITVRVEKKQVSVQNFVGERKPRFAKIVGDTEVKVEGDDIVVKGIDIEAVSQTAANIQQITKIRRKDLRKFIDGIYVYVKE